MNIELQYIFHILTWKNLMFYPIGAKLCSLSNEFDSSLLNQLSTHYLVYANYKKTEFFYNTMRCV